MNEIIRVIFDPKIRIIFISGLSDIENKELSIYSINYAMERKAFLDGALMIHADNILQ